jgi:hypothetical protein
MKISWSAIIAVFLVLAALGLTFSPVSDSYPSLPVVIALGGVISAVLSLREDA